MYSLLQLLTINNGNSWERVCRVSSKPGNRVPPCWRRYTSSALQQASKSSLCRFLDSLGNRVAIRLSAVIPMTLSSCSRVGGASTSGALSSAMAQETRMASVASQRVPSRSNKIPSYFKGDPPFSFLPSIIAKVGKVFKKEEAVLKTKQKRPREAAGGSV